MLIVELELIQVKFLEDSMGSLSYFLQEDTESSIVFFYWGAVILIHH